MQTTTSAPGKLFLFGEYGVLAGGWSVVAAVDRRVVARRRASSRYEALGADLDDPSALPLAVLAELSDEDSTCTLDELSTDIRALFSGSAGPNSAAVAGEKLGLGSSAASTVALCAVCMRGAVSERDRGARIDDAMRRRIFERAFSAHRRLQGGRGSCADVAASAFGGVVAYRLRDACAPFERCQGPDFGSDGLAGRVLTRDVADVLACRPPTVRIEPIWLGRPAVSTSFVGRCEDALRRSPRAVQDALCRTSRIAAAAIEALEDGDEDRLLALVGDADDALERLGELIEAPIVTDAHRSLRRCAARFGVSVKPSGAGGGDFSVAFGPADASWDAFFADLPGGVRHLPMTLGADGVRIDDER